MKLLIVHPGASYSTADVHRGYVAALRDQGHTCLEYLLDERIDEAGAFLAHRYRRLGRPRPDGFNRLVTSKACADIPGMALYHDVDGVLIVSGMYLDPDVLVMLRRAGVRTALLLTESPYDDLQQARVIGQVDVAFTNERASVSRLRSVQSATYYLGHAYDPDVHRPRTVMDAAIPAHDVVFVGTLFQERVELLAGVNWDGIDLGLYGTFTLLGSRHRLRRYIRGGITSNADAARLYRRAKVGLNLYRQSIGFGRRATRITHAESLNPRALELAACGVYHLSDERAEVTETFGALVPTFSTAGELEALVRRYLRPDHNSERRAIAAALPATVAHATFDARAEELVARLAAVWQGATTRLSA